MGIRENSQLYQTVFHFLKQSGCIFNENTIILSDNHSCIKQFCNENNFYQCLCYRHFIECFGSRSFIGTIISNLLFTKSLEDYENELVLSLSSLNYYLTVQTIDQAHLTRFGQYTGFYFPKNNTGQYDLVQGENPLFSKLCLWNRADVPTCTNHIESIHSKINSKIKGKHDFLSGLIHITEYIIKKYQNSRIKNGRNFRNELKRVSKISSNLVKLQTEICNCPEKIVLSMRYIYSRCP